MASLRALGDTSRWLFTLWRWRKGGSWGKRSGEERRESRGKARRGGERQKELGGGNMERVGGKNVGHNERDVSICFPSMYFYTQFEFSHQKIRVGKLNGQWNFLVRINSDAVNISLTWLILSIITRIISIFYSFGPIKSLLQVRLTIKWKQLLTWERDEPFVAFWSGVWWKDWYMPS